MGVLDEVGDIFLVLAPYFKMYTVYCGNQPEAVSYLKSQKNNSELSLFLQVCIGRSFSYSILIIVLLIVISTACCGQTVGV